MKKLILTVVIAGIFFACGNKVESNLTDYSWEVEKVLDLKTGAINQTGKVNEKIWNFASDNTYQYKTSDGGNEDLIKGEWQLNNNYLLIYNEFDSTNVQIEKINAEKMVWLIPGDDSLRFYLNSKAKQVEVANFPNKHKQ
nr:hypothetical protein [uncultured Draconibacterium sp.]